MNLHNLLQISPEISMQYFLKGSLSVALFCHVMPLSWTSLLETGNYVPETETAPEGHMQVVVTI